MTEEWMLRTLTERADVYIPAGDCLVHDVRLIDRNIVGELSAFSGLMISTFILQFILSIYTLLKQPGIYR